MIDTTARSHYRVALGHRHYGLTILTSDRFYVRSDIIIHQRVLTFVGMSLMPCVRKDAFGVIRQRHFCCSQKTQARNKILILHYISVQIQLHF